MRFIPIDFASNGPMPFLILLELELLLVFLLDASSKANKVQLV